MVLVHLNRHGFLALFWLCPIRLRLDPYCLRLVSVRLVVLACSRIAAQDSWTPALRAYLLVCVLLSAVALPLDPCRRRRALPVWVLAQFRVMCLRSLCLLGTVFLVVRAVVMVGAVLTVPTVLTLLVFATEATVEFKGLLGGGCCGLRCCPSKPLCGACYCVWYGWTAR